MSDLPLQNETPPENKNELQQRLRHAVQWAEEAGKLILGYYQHTGLRVERKADASPVTEADRNAEMLLRRRVTEVYPQDGFLGEEHGEVPAKNGYRWIVDPIDGTKAFVAGVPLFGTLIGLECGDEVVLGVCRFPALNEVIFAARDLDARWQRGDEAPQTIRVSNTAALSEALFCYTEFDLFRQVQREEVFRQLVERCRGARGWGDCYGHMLVATGRAEIMVDPVMNAWDAAALLPILREAGGHYLSWEGEPGIHGGNGVSVNAALRGEVLSLLRRQ